MRVELPEFKRCCFCMPLRRGIIVWAYANLVFQALFLYIGVHLIVLMVHWVELIGIGNIVLEICGLLLILNSCVYSILIIVASHKKSPKLLRISYIYGIVQWILSIMFSVCVLYSELNYVQVKPRFGEGSPATSTVIIDMVTLLAAEFIQILIQGYMILMLRTETRKLREQRLEIEFVNNAAESEARCVSVSAHCSRDDDDDFDSEKNEARCFSVSAHCSQDDNDNVHNEKNEARCVSAVQRDNTD